MGLKISEQYSIAPNKWSQSPSLNQARRCPGSIALPSKIVFCFCGSYTFRKELNSIERLENEREWIVLPLNNEIKRVTDLGAVLYEGSILLFGGTNSSPGIMYKFSEEGELIEDLSEGRAIPRFICF